jgi:hypothetical protein
MNNVGFGEGLGSCISWFVFGVSVKLLAPLCTKISQTFVQSGSTDCMFGLRGDRW